MRRPSGWLGKFSLVTEQLFSSRYLSLFFLNSDSTLKLRIHRLDGFLEREDSISVQAAYGDLRVFNSKVYLCTSSGPTNASDEAATPHQVRLGSDTDSSNTTAVFADQILEWDTTSGAFRRIRIPDPMRVRVYISRILSLVFLSSSTACCGVFFLI